MPYATTTSRPAPRDHAARIAVWGLVQFGLHLLEQLAELLAPLAFVAGILWLAILHVAASVAVDNPQVQAVLERLPTEIAAGGHRFAPGSLIAQGILLMMVVAACRTAGAIIAKET